MIGPELRQKGNEMKIQLVQKRIFFIILLPLSLPLNLLDDITRDGVIIVISTNKEA